MKLSEATYFPDAKELTRHGFVSHMEDFIGKLLGDNPLGADVDDYLKGFGIDAPKALKMLTTPEIADDPNSAVVIKTERIKNGGYDENGKPMRDEFQVIYKVPKRNPEMGIKGIDEKLRNLYIKMFENHIIEGTVLNEDGECGLGAEGDYPFYDTQAFKKKNGSTDIVRRSISTYSPKNESKKMKRPIGRLTMYITEAQMEELAKLIKEDGECNLGADGSYPWYDAPVSRGKENDKFWKPATDTNNILSRKNKANQSTGYDGRSVKESKSGIHIKEKNKGKFTATKKRTGKSTSELLNSPNKKTRARANFARMAKRGWKPLKKD